MAKCYQCRKRTDARYGCPFCGRKPLCFNCVCDSCWCKCDIGEPDIHNPLVCRKCGKRNKKP